MRYQFSPKFVAVYIAIINGPNLNLLGMREPEIYGNTDFNSYLQTLREHFDPLEIKYSQSNVEGEIVNLLQQYGLDNACTGIVLNAAGYSHTSVAIPDAVAAINSPVIAVHISNIFNREKERHIELLSAKCKGLISGLGLHGYHLAIQSLLLGQ